MNAVQSHRDLSIRTLLLHLMAMLMISVCSMAIQSCAGESGLPSIVADRTTCSNCKMLVSETAYATAFRMGGEDQLFDDIGCMLDKLASDDQLKPEQFWVRDLPSDRWIDAQSASFAFSKQMKTPMGFGYVAYGQKPEAEKAASTFGGIVLSGFSELQAHYKNNEHAHN